MSGWHIGDIFYADPRLCTWKQPTCVYYNGVAFTTARKTDQRSYNSAHTGRDRYGVDVFCPANREGHVKVTVMHQLTRRKNKWSERDTADHEARKKKKTWLTGQARVTLLGRGLRTKWTRMNQEGRARDREGIISHGGRGGGGGGGRDYRVTKR